MPAHVAFAKPMDGIAPVISAIPSSSELVADGGESTAVAKASDVAVVVATSDVYVAFGTTPGTPSATNGHRIPSGAVQTFGNLDAGFKMAVVAV